MSLKNILNFFFVLKLLLNCFYPTFKKWLQEFEKLYTYLSLIRLSPNFYDMYIMYSQYHFIQSYSIYYYYYYYLQSKVQKISNGYDYFWCTYWYDCTQLFGTQVSNLKKYYGNIHKSKSRITNFFWTMVFFEKTQRCIH